MQHKLAAACPESRSFPECLRAARERSSAVSALDSDPSQNARIPCPQTQQDPSGFLSQLIQMRQLTSQLHGYTEVAP